MVEKKIEIKGLTKIFGSRSSDALKGLSEGQSKDEIRQRLNVNVGVNRVSLEIAKGELFVIMGLSGSGKSTLLRCLNRLIEPTAGSILVDGQDIMQLNTKQLLLYRQQKMAMVFQKFALLPHRTVAENVAFGLEVQKVPREIRLKLATEKLGLVGLDGWGDQYPSALSGGMQQRVGLARALATDPDILLMDEAFSALDPLIREDMQSELLNLQNKLHKTIIFITHDLNEALKIGDRIALMKDGELVQVGTPDEIISSPADAYVARFVRGVDLTKVLTAKDVMKRPSPIIRIKDGPRTALHTLQSAGLSSGFVVDQNRVLCGMVSADELLRAATAKSTLVAACTLQEPTVVSGDALLPELATLILQSSYPLAVVGEDGVLQGIILKSSILEALATEGGEDVVTEATSVDMG